MKSRRIYVIGSLRNPQVVEVANRLEAAGHEVFADWYGAGEIADDSWQAYETARGRTYFEALRGPAARNIFEFDKHWLDWADTAVLVLPCGKSGHMEFGRAVGKELDTYVLFDEMPARWDQMYQFANGFMVDVEELIERL